MNHIRLMRYERKDFHFWGADVPASAVRRNVMIFEYAGVSIMVKRQLLSLLFAAVLTGAWLLSPFRIVSAQTIVAPPGRHVARESIEWIRIWLPNVVRPRLGANIQGQNGLGTGWKSHPGIKKTLPQVLLIGDSITEMYYHDVAADLKGKAYVGYVASSLCVGDPMLPAQIALILKNYKFNVIHFNNGMHGDGYSEREYARYFPQFVQTIQSNAHGAKLIWTNTTPTRAGKHFIRLSAWNNRVIARNKIADAYCRKAGIPINNLYHVLLNHPEYYAPNGGGVHEDAMGQKAEARSVADSILKALKR